MKPIQNIACLTCAWSLLLLALNSCGGASTDPSAGDGPSTPQNLGALHFSCKDGGSGYQQQQSPYQQQQSCKGHYSFDRHKVSDLNVKMDCDRGVITVQNNGSPDTRAQTFAIDNNGSVHGSMSYQEKILGYGHDRDCWIEYIVDVDGEAHCGDHDGDSLKLRTGISMKKTSQQKLHAAGVTDENGALNENALAATETSGRSADPFPSESSSPPCPSPSPSGSLTVCPSPSPTQSDPTPYPSPSMSPHPHPPRPTIIPVVVCEVEEPCEMSAETDLSCPG